MPSLLAASDGYASIADFFQRLGGETFGLIAAAVLHAAFVLAFFGAAPLFFIWLERKVAGRIQDRMGPTRVGGKYGWLQSLADGIKLIQKEDLCPAGADALLFRVSPYLVFVATFTAFIVLPFSVGYVGLGLDTGVFFILAVMSNEVVGVILAGYSSGSKWSLFGGMREAAQVVSYEIPMAICALVPVIVAGTLNFTEIGFLQQGVFVTNWFLFHDPFTFLAFFCYFVVATASVKRAPFDLAEAESELVAGFHTEYSGIRWSYFFMAEYASMFAVSGIAVMLFLGGWWTGLGIDAPIREGIRAGLGGGAVGLYVADLFSLVVFMFKASLLVFLQIWVRWTLPRLRIDQVMTTCLKYLLPISCFLLLMVTLWPWILVKTVGRPSLVNPSQVGSAPLAERFVLPEEAIPVVKKTAVPGTTRLPLRSRVARRVSKGETPGFLADASGHTLAPHPSPLIPEEARP